VARASRIVRVDRLLDRKTERLSGGEMQRVSIGRAIVRNPRIFLMDEPLSNLDAKLREALRAELKDLKSKLGATFLFVTHDQVEAMSMGDRVAVLNRGSIVQIGTPQEIYNKPCSVFVAGFVGSPAMNLFPAEMKDGKAIIVPGEMEIGIEGPLAAKLAGSSRPVTLGIRAEDIRVGLSEHFPAVVHDVENHGVEKVVTLRAGVYHFRATVPAVDPIAINDTARFGVNLERIHAFDTQSGRSLSSR
jgi:multiple sugar transport system ATP-binding protein